MLLANVSSGLKLVDACSYVVSDLNIKDTNSNFEAMSKGFCFVLYGMAYCMLLLVISLMVLSGINHRGFKYSFEMHNVSWELWLVQFITVHL